MLRVKNGFTYQQVSNELKEIYPGERGFLHLPLNVWLNVWDCRLVDDLVGSTKSQKFIPTNVYQINRDNHHSNKQKFPCFDYVITHQHEYRLIDGCFHENLAIHLNNSFLNFFKHFHLDLNVIYCSGFCNNS